MDPNTLNIIKGAAGAAGEKVYVEDVFNTTAFKANGSTGQDFVTGLDLGGKGGMVWHKDREYTFGHSIWDTERGTSSVLNSNNSDVPSIYPNSITFNSDGHSVTGAQGNEYTDKTVAWSFRKAPGFFDVVTWNGNNGSSKTISHNLGCIPGLIIARNYTANGYSWAVYAKHGQSGTYNARLLLNSSDGRDNLTTTDWSTDPADFTKDSFTVGSGDLTNMDGQSHVAYLFADGADADAQIFGDDGNESIIKCGSYTGDGGNDKVIDLGWEPQYVLLKNTSAGSTNWRIFNNMTGWIAGVSNGADSTSLRPNTNDIESASQKCYITSTGFKFDTTETAVEVNAQASDNDTYVYVAIRRGPMKTPTDATEVFDDVAYQGTSGAHDVPISPSYADLVFYKRRASSVDNWGWTSRLQGNLAHLTSNGPLAQNSLAPGSNAEANRAAADALEYDRQSSFGLVGTSSGEVNVTPEDYISYAFKRAPGFFDIVCYTATSGNTQEVPHNLGVQPELMIFKSRGATNNWWVYHKDLGASKVIQLDKNVGADTSTTWLNNTVPDEDGSVFTLGSDTGNDGGYANWSTTTYIAYLFASCPGICGIGTYTSNGEPQNIECGFSAGARFILIKRHDNNSDWYVFDAARGINSGNDPYVMLNRNDAEVTTADCIDPYSPGFTVAGSGNSNALINYTGENFIYLAIA
jgi:hypothetical protein